MPLNNINISFGGLQNSKAESRTSRDACYSMSNCFVDGGILEGSKRYALFGSRSGASSGDVGWGLGYGKYSGNEVQLISITGTATGGTFTLRWRPDSSSSYQTTSAIPYNCSVSGFLSIVEALSNVSPGDLRVTKGPLPAEDLRVQFQQQYANLNVDMFELVTNSLSGVSPSVSIIEEIRGGTAEEYLAVVQPSGSVTSNLYSVNVASGTYTQEATGLHSSDWYFAQYQQRIWAVNLTDGLNFKTIGGSWNNGITATPPNRPGQPPTVVENLTQNTATTNLIPLSSASAYIASGFSVAPTIIALTDGRISVNTNADESNRSVSVIAVFNAAVDYAFRDPTYVQFTTNATANIDPDYTIDLINNDATPITISPPLMLPGQPRTWDTSMAVLHFRWFHFIDELRKDRDNTIRVKISWTYTNCASGAITWIGARHGSVFMADDRAVGDQGQSFVCRQDKIKYAYSLYRASDGVESELSEFKETTAKVPSDRQQGCWVTLTAQPSTEINTTTDRIFFYRLEKVGSKWRRLPNVASWDGSATLFGCLNTNASGVPGMTDKWMEHELKDFPEYVPFSGFPGTSRGIYPDQIGVWKQCLVIGANKQAWISFVGQPTNFAPSPDDVTSTPPNENELDRGKTEYVSDNRSEDVYGVHGQDSLYLITPLSTYSIIGDTPAESTPPRRLPHSRGTLGKRSSYMWGGGLGSAAEDGLWFYSVGRGFSGEDNGSLVAREETKDVRTSYFYTLLASSRSASAVVFTEYDNELWLFNGTKYLCQTRNNFWIEGTFLHSVKATMGIRHLPLRFLDSTGSLYNIGKEYTTDAGSSVTWTYTTGILDSERSRIRRIEMRGTGTPVLTFTVYDGNTPTQTQILKPERQGQNYIYPVNLQPGFRYRLSLSGTAGTDSVEYLALGVEAPGEGSGN